MTMHDRPPAFLLYVNDFLADEKVAAMTTRQIGAYFLLLCRAWHQPIAATIPNDDATLRMWAKLSATEWAEDRAAILAPFEPLGDRLIQKRLAQEAERYETRSNSARRSARARWGERPKTDTKPGHANAMRTHEDTVCERNARDECERNAIKSNQIKSNQQENIWSDPPNAKTANSDTILVQGDLIQTDYFATFWASFPRLRRRGKRKAEAAWDNAIKRGADPELILERLNAYASSPLGRSEFVCLPVTWLNQDRWDDDPSAWECGDKKPGKRSAASYLAKSRIQNMEHMNEPAE